MFKTKILAIAIAMATLTASAQVATSPYSKIGYGFISDNATGVQRSMGGVGYAMQNGRNINVMNPASYSQVDSLTFLWDMGLDLTNLWSKEGDERGYSFGGGLDYMAGHFKITKGMGGAFGLVPYSSVGYSFGNDLKNDNGEVRSGTGGFNQLFVGVGYEPVKGLCIGANVAYLFGTTSNSSNVVTESITLYNREMEIRDYNVQIGLQYGVTLRDGKDRLVFGATYQPRKSFHGHTWGIVHDSQDTKPDTVGYTSLSGKYEQPHSIGAGVSYCYNNKVTAEVDFTYQQWAKSKYTPIEGFEAPNVRFNNRYKVAAGVQYTPNRRGSYFGGMVFRFGGHYTHDYINVTGNNVRDYGLACGISLPVAGGKSMVNIGLEWNHRYSKPVMLIRENYLNITLGITFNELWFWKSRIR